MNQRPIIMSAEGVRAILDGRKTQTRRVIKPQPPNHVTCCKPYCTGTKWPLAWYWQDKRQLWNSLKPLKCPYGKVGGKLYVRESHKLTKFNRDGERWVRCEYRYEVDGDKATREFRWADIPKPQRNRLRRIRTWDKWRPPRFMYKFLARIWLEITNIRVERVQDIDNDWNDCLKEGVMGKNEACCDCHGLYIKVLWRFRELWDSLNAKRGYPWEKNPWVWVIEFKNANCGQSVRKPVKCL